MYLVSNMNGLLLLYENKPVRTVKFNNINIQFWHSPGSKYIILSKVPNNIKNITWKDEPVFIDGEFSDYNRYSLMIDENGDNIIYYDNLKHET